MEADWGNFQENSFGHGRRFGTYIDFSLFLSVSFNCFGKVGVEEISIKSTLTSAFSMQSPVQSSPTSSSAMYLLLHHDESLNKEKSILRHLR